MCYFVARSHRQLICHCLSRHQLDGGKFSAVCGQNGCSYQTKSWHNLKMHLRRKHPMINITEAVDRPSLPSDSEDSDGSIQENVPNNQIAPHQNDLNYNRLMTKFLLGLETDHRVTKTSLNYIAATTSHLIRNAFKLGISQVKDILNELGEEEIGNQTDRAVEEVERTLIHMSQKFSNKISREKMYCLSGGFVPPVEVILGRSLRRRSGKVIRKAALGYYIPLKPLIQELLNMPEIWYHFKNTKFSADGLCRNVCDGNFVKSHPLYVNRDNFLQLSLFFDDFDVTNPLRSSQKFKISMFYLQILNLPPELRSKLSSIYLVAVARAKDLQRFGYKGILEDFVNTVNDLRSTGISMNINNFEDIIKGDLIFVVCDNLGAASLGGFKEGMGFAMKGCRRCKADKRTMKINFRSEDFQLRTMTTYDANCEVLEDPNMTKANLQFYSKIFGINHRSILRKIDGFSVVCGLPFDNMHCISQGLSGYILSLFLNYCIYEMEYFTLEYLNDKVLGFDYLLEDRKQLPEPIMKKHLTVDNFVKQKAMAMNLLIFTLPLILSQKVPNGNRYYRHFMYLVQLTQLAFSPYCSEDSTEIEFLVEKLGTQWEDLYPHSSVKPKMHFCCHMGDDQKAYGPLHGTSALRFEGKHAWFSQLRIVNFRNLPKTLSNKHALYLANQLSNATGGRKLNYLYDGDEVSEGELMEISVINHEVYDTLCNLLGQRHTFQVYETNKMVIHGIRYWPGAMVNWTVDEEGIPSFGEIDHMFVLDSVKFIVLNLYETQCYLWHYHSYALEATDAIKVLRLNDLKNKFTMQKHNIDGLTLVMNRYGWISGAYD